MNIDVRRNRVGTSEELEKEETEKLVNQLIDVASLLQDIGIWVADNNIPASPNIRDEFLNKHVTLVSKKMYRNLMRPYVIADKDVDRIYSDVGVEIHGEIGVEIYSNISGQPPIIVKVLQNLYVYPPRDFESIALFTLNPNIEKELVDVLEAHKVNITTEEKVHLIDYLTIRKSLPVNQSNIEVEADTDAYTLDVWGSLKISNHPKIKVFKAFEITYDNNRECDIYRIDLNINGKDVRYEMSNGSIGLEILLSKLVPKKERSIIYDLTRKTTRIIRAYLIAKTLFKIYSKEE